MKMTQKDRLIELLHDWGTKNTDGINADSVAKHLLENNVMVLPCKVGDTVYIIEKCENIDSQLDGTLWNSDGSHGTATGYYCPYEDCCPHDTDDCKMVRDKYAIFKDTVKEIYIYEEDMLILFENCYGRYIKNFGKTIFLTREEAEKALKDGAE